MGIPRNCTDYRTHTFNINNLGMTFPVQFIVSFRHKLIINHDIFMYRKILLERVFFQNNRIYDSCLGRSVVQFWENTEADRNRYIQFIKEMNKGGNYRYRYIY